MKMSGHERKKESLWRREGGEGGIFLGMGSRVGGIGDSELGGFFRHVSRECDC